jgi:hypothetical protein
MRSDSPDAARKARSRSLQEVVIKSRDAWLEATGSTLMEQAGLWGERALACDGGDEGY